MSSPNIAENNLANRVSSLRWKLIHLDPPLLFSLVLLAIIGIFILYSASNESMPMVDKQLLRLGLSFVLLFLCAQIRPQRFFQWAPWLYGGSLALLLLVLVIGHVDMGARRWLGVGGFAFQPSELMKLALPMMLARYLSQQSLPPKFTSLVISLAILLAPTLLIAKEPDLGTAIIIACAGFSVLLFAGISWRLIASGFAALVASSPVIWHFMHGYQKQRVLTFLNPERNPLGAGYHIIQSKIAIGSGGIFGKGWLKGTQSHLSFLPAHATDFIFAVSGEELGLIGCSLIIIVFMLIFLRSLYISHKAQDNFARLLAGSLSLSFILSSFVNIGMVIGIIPVVGVPLPLISYGGSSMVITMIGFGMIMSIHTHRKLWSS